MLLNNYLHVQYNPSIKISSPKDKLSDIGHRKVAAPVSSHIVLSLLQD